MVAGHYGVCFVAKALERSIPLWILFLAAQLVDVLLAVFVLLGIEKMRVVPGITATSDFDLYYVPFTHGLPAAALWSLAALVVFKALAASGWRAAGWIAATVFSHWLLDLLVHRPDLPLYGDSCKVGLGLWNYPVLSFLLETALLFGGMAVYFRAAGPLRRGGRYGVVALGVFILALQVGAFFGPPHPVRATAWMALGSFLVLAAAIRLLERWMAG